MSILCKRRLLQASHRSIEQQKKVIALLINENPLLMTMFECIHDLPDVWLGAGCIIQNVWNVLHDMPLNTYLKDIDVLYYDADTTWDTENYWIQKINQRVKDKAIHVPVDIKNVARIHLWYSERFNTKHYPPFKNVSESVYTWPFTAAAVAVKQNPKTKELQFVAPFGFQDLLSMRLRPNLNRVTLSVCREKATRWQTQWPSLTTIGL